MTSSLPLWPHVQLFDVDGIEILWRSHAELASLVEGRACEPVTEMKPFSSGKGSVIMKPVITKIHLVKEDE